MKTWPKSLYFSFFGVSIIWFLFCLGFSINIVGTSSSSSHDDLILRDPLSQSGAISISAVEQKGYKAVKDIPSGVVLDGKDIQPVIVDLNLANSVEDTPFVEPSISGWFTKAPIKAGTIITQGAITKNLEFAGVSVPENVTASFFPFDPKTFVQYYPEPGSFIDLVLLSSKGYAQVVAEKIRIHAIGDRVTPTTIVSPKTTYNTISVGLIIDAKLARALTDLQTAGAVIFAVARNTNDDSIIENRTITLTELLKKYEGS